MIPKDKMDLYGKQVIIKDEIVCNDGTNFYDYTWQEHLKYLGLSIEKEEAHE